MAQQTLEDKIILNNPDYAVVWEDLFNARTVLDDYLIPLLESVGKFDANKGLAKDAYGVMHRGATGEQGILTDTVHEPYVVVAVEQFIYDFNKTN